MHMSNPLRVEMSGPLSTFAPGFLDELFRQGYRPETATKQLQLMAHLSRWLAARELCGSDLTATHLGQFLAERRDHHRHLVSAKGIKPLLGYLRALGVVPTAGRTAPRTSRELLIDRYSAYLLERRGVSRSTVRNYANVAREFFTDRECGRGELALDELDAAAVTAFVLREARRSSVGSAKCTVTRLRSLLRFLHVEGEISHDLTGAVPRVAGWRLASLVKALDADSVARLLRSCDERDWVGRRDLALVGLQICLLRDTVGDTEWGGAPRGVCTAGAAPLLTGPGRSPRASRFWRVGGAGFCFAGGGAVVGGRLHRGAGCDGPLWGARGGDRCALALISLALDEVDATAVVGGRRRS
jgi:site-specific recombinase XerD